MSAYNIRNKLSKWLKMSISKQMIVLCLFFIFFSSSLETELNKEVNVEGMILENTQNASYLEDPKIALITTSKDKLNARQATISTNNEKKNLNKRNASFEMRPENFQALKTTKLKQIRMIRVKGINKEKKSVMNPGFISVKKAENTKAKNSRDYIHEIAMRTKPEKVLFMRQQISRPLEQEKVFELKQETSITDEPKPEMATGMKLEILSKVIPEKAADLIPQIPPRTRPENVPDVIPEIASIIKPERAPDVVPERIAINKPFCELEAKSKSAEIIEPDVERIEIVKPKSVLRKRPENPPILYKILPSIKLTTVCTPEAKMEITTGCVPDVERIATECIQDVNLIISTDCATEAIPEITKECASEENVRISSKPEIVSRFKQELTLSRSPENAPELVTEISLSLKGRTVTQVKSEINWKKSEIGTVKLGMYPTTEQEHVTNGMKGEILSPSRSECAPQVKLEMPHVLKSQNLFDFQLRSPSISKQESAPNVSIQYIKKEKALKIDKIKSIEGSEQVHIQSVINHFSTQSVSSRSRKSKKIKVFNVPRIEKVYKSAMRGVETGQDIISESKSGTKNVEKLLDSTPQPIRVNQFEILVTNKPRLLIKSPSIKNKADLDTPTIDAQNVLQMEIVNKPNNILVHSLERNMPSENLNKKHIQTIGSQDNQQENTDKVLKNVCNNPKIYIQKLVEQKNVPKLRSSLVPYGNEGRSSMIGAYKTMIKSPAIMKENIDEGPFYQTAKTSEIDQNWGKNTMIKPNREQTLPYINSPVCEKVPRTPMNSKSSKYSPTYRKIFDSISRSIISDFDLDDDQD